MAQQQPNPGQNYLALDGPAHDGQVVVHQPLPPMVPGVASNISVPQVLWSLYDIIDIDDSMRIHLTLRQSSSAGVAGVTGSNIRVSTNHVGKKEPVLDEHHQNL